MAQVAEQLEQQPGLDAEPSLVLGLSPAAFGLLGKWAGVTHPNEKYVTSKIQRGPPGIVPIFWL